jgi:PilZ domain
MRTADVPAVTSLQDSICQELPLSCSGETQWDDQSLSTPSGITGSELITAQHSVQSNEESSKNSAPVFLQQNNTSGDVHPESRQVGESIVPPVAPIQPKRNWLERWLFPDSAGQDKRSGARKPAPGLVAHFWTGGPPKSQNVRDISATGMFVVTEERWYPGTQILITLTKTLQDGPPAERSITVLATAVRWGDDGVGLEFACNAPRKTRQKEAVISDGADGEQLGQFVEQFGATNDTGPGSRGKRKR